MTCLRRIAFLVDAGMGAIGHANHLAGSMRQRGRNGTIAVARPADEPDRRCGSQQPHLPLGQLTFTGTLSVVDSGREEVRSMLVAAIGCNIAWGFVDGVMYVLRNIVARGRNARLVRAVRSAARPEQAHRLIGDEIGGLAPAMAAADVERVRQWIVAQPAPAAQGVGVTKLDMRGAIGVFLLVFASTLPVVLPFVFIADPGVAKRVSAAVAIAMLFLCGYAWGRYAGLRPWRAGLVIVLLGLAVEAIVIALGG